ncbi:MAG TPA: hypothetical protein VEF35_01900 [Candidatus Bathyarchaeia archaeon]|nr:hypothetical protein [Candidatus Bathyarchaeia archaeon]
MLSKLVTAERPRSVVEEIFDTVRKDLLIKLFQAAEMRRWNDKLCPVPLTELDKQGHEMAIAYILGKFAEHSSDFNWIGVIESGLFEYFERLTLTDLKPQICTHNITSATKVHSLRDRKRSDDHLCQEGVMKRDTTYTNILNVSVLSHEI